MQPSKIFIARMCPNLIPIKYVSSKPRGAGRRAQGAERRNKMSFPVWENSRLYDHRIKWGNGAKILVVYIHGQNQNIKALV